mmetsp:Transcript_7739/g.7296  ORF Transcript_7739/g.7296 Transcript_7739/m.7296 type:complete len:91 (+) Transcript_7739:90-362(+)
MTVPVTLNATIQILSLLFIFKKENPIYVQHCRSVSASRGSSEGTTESLYHSGINYEEDSQQSSEKSETALEKDTWTNLWKFSERKKILTS